MTLTKPSNQTIVAAVAMAVTFLGTLLTWWSVSVKYTGPLELEGLAGQTSTSGQGVDYTKGVFVLVLALLALVLFALGLAMSAFPPNVQMGLMAAPLAQCVLGAIALLLTIIGFFSSGTGAASAVAMAGISVDVSRGFGLWLTLIGALVWVIVTAIQSKALIDMGKAMKAAQTN